MILNLITPVFQWLRDNKEWVFSGVGLFVFTLLFYVGTWFYRKIRHHTRTKAGSLMVSGEYRWARNDLPHRTEVFYPQPFVFTPNISISFPEKDWRPQGRPAGGSYLDHTPVYNLIQQCPEGFTIEIKQLGDYTPYFRWQARGVIRKQENKQTTESKTAEIQDEKRC